MWSAKSASVRLFLVVLVASTLVVHANPIGESAQINSLPLQNDGHALDTTNNKLAVKVSGQDADAIVFPDQITRDSYGNPVTPFHGLVVPDIGHMTDVNNKEQELDTRGPFNKTATTDASGFVIPSYASGITKVEILQPPNAPVFPLVAPTKKSATEATPALNTLANDILPPYQEHEQKIQYPTIEVNTQATIFFPDPAFFNQINNQQQPGNKVNHIPVVPSQLTTTTASTITTTTKSSEHLAVPTLVGNIVGPLGQKTNNGGDIYRGTFGGSSGVLGEPQPLGYYHVNKKNGQPAVAPTTSISIPHHHHHVQQSAAQAPTQSHHSTFLDLNLLPPAPPPQPPLTNHKPAAVSNFSHKEQTFC